MKLVGMSKMLLSNGSVNDDHYMIMVATVTLSTTEGPLGYVFCVRSVPICYKQDKSRF